MTPIQQLTPAVGTEVVFRYRGQNRRAVVATTHHATVHLDVLDEHGRVAWRTPTHGVATTAEERATDDYFWIPDPGDPSQAAPLGVFSGQRGRVRNTMKDATIAPDMNANLLIDSGLDHYVAGRGAALAGLTLPAGHMFHFAIELLLKARLANDGMGAAEIRRNNHGLDGLWAEVKTRVGVTDLDEFDEVIRDLMPFFGKLRYPDNMPGSLFRSFGWRRDEPRNIGSDDRNPGTPNFYFRVGDVDALIARLFDVVSIDPHAVFGRSEFGDEACRLLITNNAECDGWLPPHRTAVAPPGNSSR